MAKILIKNGRVWDGTCFQTADVLTDGEKIEKVAPHLAEEKAFVYDASGKIVSAGLVDTHVHLRGVSNERFGIHGEMSAFPFGVTAVADGGAEFGSRELLDSFQLKNVVFVPVSVKENHAIFQKTEKKLAEYGEKAVGIKLYFDTSSGAVRDLTPLRETCEFARSRGLRVMVHSSNQPVPMAELLGELSAGDIITHAYHGGSHSAVEDGFESLKAARKRGVIVDAGFAGHVHTDFAVLKKALACGMLPDTISTDITVRSAYMRGGRYGMTLCMSMAKEAGMQEEDIFRAVTSAPAKILGKENEWGTLQAGKTADLAVLDFTDEGFDLTDKEGNRLASEKGYRCVLTISDGQIVWRD